MLKVKQMQVVGPHSLDLEFNNGIRKRVNLLPLLWGEVFEPLRDPAYFSRAMVDPRSGVVMWPNEADFAPEALYALTEESEADLPRATTAPS